MSSESTGLLLFNCLQPQNLPGAVCHTFLSRTFQENFPHPIRPFSHPSLFLLSLLPQLFLARLLLFHIPLTKQAVPHSSAPACWAPISRLTRNFLWMQDSPVSPDIPKYSYYPPTYFFILFTESVPAPSSKFLLYSITFSFQFHSSKLPSKLLLSPPISWGLAFLSFAFQSCFLLHSESHRQHQMKSLLSNAKPSRLKSTWDTTALHQLLSCRSCWQDRFC